MVQCRKCRGTGHEHDGLDSLDPEQTACSKCQGKGEVPVSVPYSRTKERIRACREGLYGDGEHPEYCEGCYLAQMKEQFPTLVPT